MTSINYSPQYNFIKKYLVACRLDKNITQSELAIILKKPQSYISKYENGEKILNIIELIIITDALDVSIEDLISKIKEIPHA